MIELIAKYIEDFTFTFTIWHNYKCMGQMFASSAGLDQQLPDTHLSTPEDEHEDEHVCLASSYLEHQAIVHVTTNRHRRYETLNFVDRDSVPTTIPPMCEASHYNRPMYCSM